VWIREVRVGQPEIRRLFVHQRDEAGLRAGDCPCDRHRGVVPEGSISPYRRSLMERRSPLYRPISVLSGRSTSRVDETTRLGSS